MRDFIHFLNYLNRHSTILTGITEEMIVRALERNFSGIDSKAFLDILQCFVPDQVCYTFVNYSIFIYLFIKLYLSYISV